MVKFWGCAGSGCRGLSDLVRKGGLGLRVSLELLQVSLWGKDSENEKWWVDWGAGMVWFEIVIFSFELAAYGLN
jgi:hypothetical protein